MGTETDSADTQGKIISEKPYEHITQLQVEEVFKQFVGEGEQVPPMVSAVKVGGKKLYELARKGIVVERQARKIRIDTLRLDEMDAPFVKFYMACSKGTYVRQLAHDVGQILGCGACISQIERVNVGKYSINDSVLIEDIDESHIRRWED